MVQFPEHENGNKSYDPKVMKLDKLARLLKVKIHIDGISYGFEESSFTTSPAVSNIIKKVADNFNEQSENKSNDDTTISTQVKKDEEKVSEDISKTGPRRGRPKKNS